MESKIISQQKNPFLEREEFVIEIKSESGVPKKEEIVADLGKNPELTIVRRVNTKFGRRTFSADVIVYDNAEAKGKYLVIPKKVKKKMEAERVAEEKKRREAEAKAAAEAAAKAAAEKVEEAGE